MAATDRYRLAEDSPSWTMLRADMAEARYLVPAKTAADFAKGAAGKVTVGFGTNPVTGEIAAFSDDNRTLTVHTMTGDFPRYQAMFRSEHTTEIIADSGDLASAVKVCGEMAEYGMVHLTITDGQVQIEATRDGATAAQRVIPALLTGAELTIWFSAAYLSGMASSIKGPVRLAFLGPKKPAEITAANGSYRAILVPSRVEDDPEPKPEDEPEETAAS
jgi:DNA polymerase III sliding clamp (beta) subunit (PCNA family)